MIDCDIHPQLGNVDEFLGYVEPAQREWFRLQGPTLGLPGYPWNHPSSFFRQDLEHGEALPPGSTAAEVVRDLLDPYDVDVGVLNGDDAIYLSLVASPYRATEFARAHNEWIRERWLDADPRLRGGIVCAVQDPLAAASEIRRVAQDPRFVHVVLVGGSERPYGEPRYLPIFEAAAECGLPIAIHSGGEGMGLAAPPGGAGMPTFYIEWHTLGSAGSIMAHLVSLICHGVFERLPSLKRPVTRGRSRLASRDPLAARHQLAGAAARHAVARAQAERGGPRAREVHDRSRSSTPTATTSCSSRCSRRQERRTTSASPLTTRTGTETTLRTCSSDCQRAWRERIMNGSAAELYGARLGLVAA